MKARLPPGTRVRYGNCRLHSLGADQVSRDDAFFMLQFPTRVKTNCYLKREGFYEKERSFVAANPERH
jgi:hypothetical protein